MVVGVVFVGRDWGRRIRMYHSAQKREAGDSKGKIEKNLTRSGRSFKFLIVYPFACSLFFAFNNFGAQSKSCSANRRDHDAADGIGIGTPPPTRPNRPMGSRYLRGWVCVRRGSQVGRHPFGAVLCLYPHHDSIVCACWRGLSTNPTHTQHINMQGGESLLLASDRRQTD